MDVNPCARAAAARPAPSGYSDQCPGSRSPAARPCERTACSGGRARPQWGAAPTKGRVVAKDDLRRRESEWTCPCLQGRCWSQSTSNEQSRGSRPGSPHHYHVRERRRVFLGRRGDCGPSNGRSTAIDRQRSMLGIERRQTGRIVAAPCGRVPCREVRQFLIDRCPRRGGSGLRRGSGAYVRGMSSGVPCFDAPRRIRSTSRSPDPASGRPTNR